MYLSHSPDRATSLHSQAIGQNPSESLTEYRINNNAQLELRTAIVTFTLFPLSEIIFATYKYLAAMLLSLHRIYVGKALKMIQLENLWLCFIFLRVRAENKFFCSHKQKIFFLCFTFVVAVGKEKGKCIYSNSVNKV